MNKTERNELMISWVTISLAFAAIQSSDLFGGFSPFIRNFAEAFIISLVAVGTGFIFHELAHKHVALRYGAHAEFRMWKMGLMLALFTGLLALFTPFKFLFAAPGAVYIYGPNITRKQNGIISIAGPITNIIIALVFFLLFTFFPFGFFGKMFGFGIIINLFLAMFNMLPIFPLDGSKVIAWDVKIWALVFFPLVFFFLFLF